MRKLEIAVCFLHGFFGLCTGLTFLSPAVLVYLSLVVVNTPFFVAVRLAANQERFDEWKRGRK